MPPPKPTDFQISNGNKMSKKVDFVKSLKDFSDADLKARIQEDEMRIKKLEFAHAITPLENPMSIRSLRRDVARLKTELRKRAITA
jgi:large subunit ribosomal protein L29